MVSNIGFGTYFVFASCLTVSIPFVYFFLPETKGVPLEEIDMIFSRNSRLDDPELQSQKIDAATHIEETKV
jgi:hypothetical protein